MEVYSESPLVRSTPFQSFVAVCVDSANPMVGSDAAGDATVRRTGCERASTCRSVSLFTDASSIGLAVGEEEWERDDLRSMAGSQAGDAAVGGVDCERSARGRFSGFSGKGCTGPETRIQAVLPLAVWREFELTVVHVARPRVRTLSTIVRILRSMSTTMAWVQ